MKLFFADKNVSSLFHPDLSVLHRVRETILAKELAEETLYPDQADAIIIQENNEYKDCRYSERLLKDRFVQAYLNKIFTLSTDDSATGLFRGLYASIPKKRFDRRFHRAVPYMEYSNEYVFTDKQDREPQYLAGWYGNTKSNLLRRTLVDRWQPNSAFTIKVSQSWYDHPEEEQKDYVALIKSARFSLCPAGWAPPSPRIYESMALGRCPVIISDEFVRPEGPDWDAFALFYPESCLSRIDTFLRERESLYKELGAKAKEAWNQYFSGELLPLYYAKTLLSLIRETPQYTNEQEVKRWRSFSTHWNNNWTIPQRLVNRYRALIRKAVEDR